MIRIWGALGALLPYLTRRGWNFRIVRSGAYLLGEQLGNRHRVVIGRLPGGSPIALALEDHQHREIYFHGEYEPELTNLFATLVGPGSVVYDVGANAGYFTLLCRDLGAQVHSFEPNPALRRLLNRSLSLRPGGATVIPTACSDRAGMKKLFLSDSGNTGMSGFSHRGGPSVDVPILTLDDYSDRSGSKPDVVKIDVEGHEREVLKGAEAVLLESRPTVIVETNHPDIFETMDRRGYAAHNVQADGTLRPHTGTLALNQKGFENVCFLPV
jgi:FkbM family methyltransferase